MNLTAEQKRIRILAIRCWTHGELPSDEDKPAVLEHIISHPDLFKNCSKEIKDS